MASQTQTTNENQSFDPITQKWRENTNQAVGQLMGGYGLSSIFGNSGLGRAPAPPMEYNQYAALRNRMAGSMPNLNAVPPPPDPTNTPPRGLLAPQQPQYRQFGEGAFRPQVGGMGGGMGGMPRPGGPRPAGGMGGGQPAGGQVMDPRMLQMMMQRGGM